jgi:hypothetical protein
MVVAAVVVADLVVALGWVVALYATATATVHAAVISDRRRRVVDVMISIAPLSDHRPD